MRQQRASCVASVRGEEGVLASRVERGRHPVGSVEEAGRRCSRASPDSGIVSQPSPTHVVASLRVASATGIVDGFGPAGGGRAGAVLGMASGRVRTDSAYGRLVAQSSPADLMVAPATWGSVRRRICGQRCERSAGCRRRRRDLLPAMGHTSSGYGSLPFEAATGARRTGTSGAVNRWKILAGHRADPGRIEEAVASFEFARQFHVGAGDTVDLRFLPLATRARLLPAYQANLPDYAGGRVRRLGSCPSSTVPTSPCG